MAEAGQELAVSGGAALAKTSELEQENFELLVVFKLAGQEYGLLAGTVREIIRNRVTTRVPNVAEHVQGVINLRGRIVPVFNLRQRLKLPPVPEDEAAAQTIMVVESDGSDAGILADSVSDVVKITESEINTSARKVEAGMGQQFVHGTVLLDQRLVTMLVVDALLAD